MALNFNHNPMGRRNEDKCKSLVCSLVSEVLQVIDCII